MDRRLVRPGRGGIARLRTVFRGGRTGVHAWLLALGRVFSADSTVRSAEPLDSKLTPPIPTALRGLLPNALAWCGMLGSGEVLRFSFPHTSTYAGITRGLPRAAQVDVAGVWEISQTSATPAKHLESVAWGKRAAPAAVLPGSQRVAPGWPVSPVAPQRIKLG